MTNKLEAIAYYLGQFSPTPENDLFWGSGFTEWHNVANARPLYPGHRQPMLPGALGFYDLRCEETIAAQMAMAKSAGISTFCFWHYWFGGRRLLHQALDTMLELPDPGMKFMLAWANESWSGIWHGAASKILIEQTYDPQECEAHASTLARYMRNDRHLRLQDGRVPFVIYKPNRIPGGAAYLARLRAHVEQATGERLYLIGNSSGVPSERVEVPALLNLDAAVLTPVAPWFTSPRLQKAYSLSMRGLRAARLGPEIRRYSKVSRWLTNGIAATKGVTHSTIVTGWDNTPRSGRRGLVLEGYSEASFRTATRHALNYERTNDSPLLFIKSWNEWAEGNTAEPLFRESWSVLDTLRAILTTGS